MYRANGPTGTSGHRVQARRVQGWALARDLTIAGVIVHAFLRAQRERAGPVAAPANNPPLEPSPGR